MASTLLKLLVEAGELPPQLAEEARQRSDEAGIPVGTSVLLLTPLDEDRLAAFISRQLACPRFDPDSLKTLPPILREFLTMDQALRHRVIPLRLEQQGLLVAMADPTDPESVEDLGSLTGHPLLPLVAPEGRLLRALARCYERELPQIEQRLLAHISPTVTVRPITEEEIDESLLEEAQIIDDGIEVDTGEGPPCTASALEPPAEDHRPGAASGREEVADVLIAQLGGHFEHMALFRLREGSLRGWRGMMKRRRIDDFDAVEIPAGRSTVLQSVLRGKSPFVGRITEPDLRERLHRALGAPPDQVILLPLLVAGRAVGMVYVEGAAARSERLAWMQQLLGKVASALEILILRNKLARP